MTDNDFADLYPSEADYDAHTMTFVRLITTMSVLGEILMMFSYNPQLREVESLFVELMRSEFIELMRSE
jgi:hypothetical protein